MRFLIFATCALLSLFVFSQSEINFDFRKNMRHVGDMPEGYVWETGLRVPFSFSHSQARLGIDNGNYIDLAAKFKSSLHYRQLLHDWSTSLFLGEGWSMTPNIKDRFIKSKDLFRIETRYLYNMRPWLSPYAHARMETSLFKSIDIDAHDNNYVVLNPDGTVSQTFTGKELRTGDPFRPLFFQENIGIAAAIIEEEAFNWETRAGVSARQTIAEGQKAFVEQKNDNRVFKTLESFYQMGPTLGTSIGGSVYEKRVEYAVGADTLWPVLQWPKPPERTFVKSLVLEASAGIAFKLTSWSSLSYEYSLARIPDISEKLQQNHALNLNISIDWIYTFGAPVAGT